jgi:hypothetical protein
MPDKAGFVIPKIGSTKPSVVFSDTPNIFAIRVAGDRLGASKETSLRQPAGGNADESDRPLSIAGLLGLGLPLIASVKGLAIFLVGLGGAISFWRKLLNGTWYGGRIAFADP